MENKEKEQKQIKAENLPVNDEISEKDLEMISGGDSGIANIELQNTMQKQQQTIQLLNNVGKILSDTSMNTIRKIGG